MSSDSVGGTGAANSNQPRGGPKRHGENDAVQKNEILGQNSKAEAEEEEEAEGNRGVSSWNIMDVKAADLDWQVEGFQLYQLPAAATGYLLAYNLQTLPLQMQEI